MVLKAMMFELPYAPRSTNNLQFIQQITDFMMMMIMRRRILKKRWRGRITRPTAIGRVLSEQYLVKYAKNSEIYGSLKNVQ